MKKAISALLTFALVFSLTACGAKSTVSSQPASSGAAQSTADKTIHMGLIVPTLTNDFFVNLKDGAEKYAAEQGIELTVLDSGDDAAKQASNVEDLITKNVQLVLLIPTDSDAVVNSVEALNEAKIPVITLDRSSSGGEVITHIASDNVAGGKMAGEYIIELLKGKGNVVELEGKVGTSAARDRGEGFNAAIAEASDIKVVAKQTANFDKAEGLTVMENILQAQPEIQAVFAHNDEMALGAMEACEAAGRTDILIVGFDASADAVQAVKDKKMAATVAQQPALIAQYGIDTAVKVLNGEAVEDYVPVPLELVK